MIKINKKLTRWLGAVGTLVCLGLFIHAPSFPTPDKLIIFLVLVFMIFGQGIEGLKRFGPFIAVLLTYESFRSIADKLNSHVNYLLAPHIDKLIFGNLPTIYLQNWLWQGHTSWYDVALYLPYTLHFTIPLGLGILVWKTREKAFWRVMNTFLIVAFGGFLTFLLFPAAPPWLASQNHYIEPIVRISSQVWQSLGFHNFPSFYNHIAPNPVAAIPSQHAAWATLLFIFIYKLYGWRWASLAALYPFAIFVGTIYEGEHYFFDILVGIAYALGAYLITPTLMEYSKLLLERIKKRPVRANY